MKILDYGKNKPNEEPKILRCKVCDAQFEIEAGEKTPTKCPLCGAKELAIVNSKKEKTSKVKLHPIAKAYPGLYYSFSSNAESDVVIQNAITEAVKVYFESNSGYAFYTSGGFFIAVFQEDEIDKDSYFVIVTTNYKEMSSCELEAE